MTTSDSASGGAHYSRTAITLHWIIAVLISINIGLALLSEELQGATRQSVLDLHKSFGITILGLAIVRLMWRLLHRPPPLPRAYPTHKRLMAHSVHDLLYLLMISLPLSGWVRDSAWQLASSNPMKLYYAIPWPRFGFIMQLEPAAKAAIHTAATATHMWLGYLLYALLLLHLAGVLKHHIIDRDRVIRRMLPAQCSLK